MEVPRLTSRQSPECSKVCGYECNEEVCNCIYTKRSSHMMCVGVAAEVPALQAAHSAVRESLYQQPHSQGAGQWAIWIYEARVAAWRQDGAPAGLCVWLLSTNCSRRKRVVLGQRPSQPPVIPGSERDVPRFTWCPTNPEPTLIAKPLPSLSTVPQAGSTAEHALAGISRFQHYML